MAVKGKETKPIIQKKPTKCKIVVEQGRTMGKPEVPFKVLYTEVLNDIKLAKARVEELKTEYKDVDALSVVYFSL